MKINWKVRLHSYPFWVAVFALIGLIVTDLGLMDLGHYEKYVDAILLVLIAGGIVTDPTTSGLTDSQQALTYKKPKQD
ncbi:phage holin [Caldifermentibacillus hisashii]|uniref:phage holin n=1 Tax=Caldifermentibacillus hisashii TaxID=996558 RepID=UPI001C1009B6|nr:phage holin [Caldifermentibacillus hisashii]MBU5342268.1 phage holin [Caldifermentibacillus hisashii]